MPSEKQCPDCDEPLERMKLNESHGQPSIVSTDGGFFDQLMSGTLTPVPYVCPECKRTLVYTEE
jgi:transcription initiation factor IIE alpha subunit